MIKIYARKKREIEIILFLLNEWNMNGIRIQTNYPMKSDKNNIGKSRKIRKSKQYKITI